jgi:hypothetical protein
MLPGETRLWQQQLLAANLANRLETSKLADATWHQLWPLLTIHKQLQHEQGGRPCWGACIVFQPEGDLGQVTLLVIPEPSGTPLGAPSALWLYSDRCLII